MENGFCQKVDGRLYLYQGPMIDSVDDFFSLSPTPECADFWISRDCDDFHAKWPTQQVNGPVTLLHTHEEIHHRLWGILADTAIWNLDGLLQLEQR